MSPTPSLAKGSLILVTGASGFIGSHVVNEALEAGYKVRGTARSDEKASKTKETFKHNPDYSTAVVADFQHAGAFDEAVKGVKAIIHVASDVTFSPDPNKVIRSTVDGVRGILESAKKAASVKRFVLTSSSTAVLLPHPGKEVTVTAKDWNQETLDIAYAPPPYTEDRAFAVYGASKTEGEKALWDFMSTEKPSFTATSVLPNMNTGRILSSAGATGSCIPSVYHGKIPAFPSQWQIDVQDNARLHVIAAVMDGELAGERVFAFNVPFTWTEMIEIIKKVRPDAKSVAQAPKDELKDLSKVPNELGAELLRKWYGQGGYKSLEQSVRENLEGIA